ncbi:MAG: DUF2067 family protein [Sulfolobales archaeon]
MKKSFVIKCENLCEELIDRMSEEGIEFSSVEVSGGVMRIIFSDDIINPEREIEEIRKIYSELRSRSRSGALREIELRRIQKAVEGPIIPSILCEILRIQGYKAEHGKDRIITDAPHEILIEVGVLVSMCIKNLKRRDLTSQAKELVIFACAYHRSDPDTCVRALIREGLLRDVGGVYHVGSHDLKEYMMKAMNISCEEFQEEHTEDLHNLESA